MIRSNIKFKCGHSQKLIIVPLLLEITLFGETIANQRAAEQIITISAKELCSKCQLKDK